MRGAFKTIPVSCVKTSLSTRKPYRTKAWKKKGSRGRSLKAWGLDVRREDQGRGGPSFDLLWGGGNWGLASRDKKGDCLLGVIVRRCSFGGGKATFE